MCSKAKLQVRTVRGIEKAGSEQPGELPELCQASQHPAAGAPERGQEGVLLSEPRASRGRAEGRALCTSLLRAATARAQGTAGGGKASGGAVLMAPQQRRHQLTPPSPIARGNASSHQPPVSAPRMSSSTHSCQVWKVAWPPATSSKHSPRPTTVHTGGPFRAFSGHKRATPWDNKDDTGKEAGRKHGY